MTDIAKFCLKCAFAFTSIRVWCCPFWSKGSINLLKLKIMVLDLSPGTSNDGTHGTSNEGADGPQMAAHWISSSDTAMKLLKDSVSLQNPKSW